MNKEGNNQTANEEKEKEIQQNNTNNDKKGTTSKTTDDSTDEENTTEDTTRTSAPTNKSRKAQRKKTAGASSSFNKSGTVHLRYGRSYSNKHKSNLSKYLEKCLRTAQRDEKYLEKIIDEIEIKLSKVHSERERKIKEIENNTKILNLNWKALKNSSPSNPFAINSEKLNSCENSNMTAIDYDKIVRLTSSMIPLFSDERHVGIATELQTFIGCCKQVINCLKDEEKLEFVNIVKTRFRGEAFRLIQSSKITKFKDIETLLNQNYLPRETYHELIDNLITCRQRPDEPLTSFISRIKHLLSLCKEGAKTKYSTNYAAIQGQIEDFAISALKTGVLNPHLSQFLLTLNETTLDNTVSKALEMERLQQNSVFLNHSTPINTNPSNLSTPNHNEGYSQFYPRNYGQKVLPTQQAPIPINRFQHKQNNNPTINFLKNIKCNFCHKMGHTYSDCLTRRNTPFCTYCSAYNHDFRNCKARNTNNFRVNGATVYNSQNNRYNDATKPTSFNRPHQVHTVAREKCDFCARFGHSIDICRTKIQWDKKCSENDQKST